MTKTVPEVVSAICSESAIGEVRYQKQYEEAA